MIARQDLSTDDAKSTSGEKNIVKFSSDLVKTQQSTKSQNILILSF
jgi:hypothetical protein